MRFYYFLLITILLAGCGNARWTSIWRESDLQANQVIGIDARQRFLHASRHPADSEQLVICAERSPDVFTAAASALAASGSYQQAAAALSASASESAGSMALRTQTTQTQAELLYRLCAMYGNGALNERELSTQLRRFQNTMLAMLAIEQLTGYARPAVFAIGADAGGSAGFSGAGGTDLTAARQAVTTARETVAQAEVKELEADNKVRTAQSALDRANAALNAAALDAPNRANLADAVSVARDGLQKEQNDRDVLRLQTRQARATLAVADRSLREANTAVGTRGATQANFPSPPLETGVNGNADVPAAVASIVNTIVQQNFLQETCLGVLTDTVAGRPRSASAPTLATPLASRGVGISQFCTNVIDNIIIRDRQRDIFTNDRYMAWLRSAPDILRAAATAPRQQAAQRQAAPAPSPQQGGPRPRTTDGTAPPASGDPAPPAPGGTTPPATSGPAPATPGGTTPPAASGSAPATPGGTSAPVRTTPPPAPRRPVEQPTSRILEMPRLQAP